MTDIFIGAETIVSPLGSGVEANFEAMVANTSAISRVADVGFNGESLFLSKFFSGTSTFEDLICEALQHIQASIDPTIFSSDETILIISSTKGALDQAIGDPFGHSVRYVAERFGFVHHPLVISNACISGVLAINTAGNLIRAGRYEHAIVVGCDVISNFVLYGFQSLFAIGDGPCRPFDAARNGISLGEGGGAVVVSQNKSVFQNEPMRLFIGVTANDANHISGPSRTGEGLLRAVEKTLSANLIRPSEIDFVSAHGTATVFNDEMESIAFDRAGLSEIPVNSFKGYFGHTLGAAGVIETAATMQTMRHGILIKSQGFETSGTSRPLNIVTENRIAPITTTLKTASGFGGGNAALILRKI